MTVRCVQLVLHYDGSKFAGWQRQPDQRTIQGELERVLSSLCDQPIAALGAGRTDAGVHARGQAVGVRVPERWTPGALRRSLNALLPDDLWVAAVYEMRDEFHARYSALSRGYSYFIGTDDAAHSPFRSRTEWPVTPMLDRARLVQAASAIEGEHSFRAFAVRGTAPAVDDHRCCVLRAGWRERPDATGFQFDIEANRFLHHMVRFLVGTMVAIAAGERDAADLERLLAAETNDDASPPAPAHGLFLERVAYPETLYVH
ncbi:MAG: tRNA pseudouridine(38-40) synthase TruA, partial [Gemmatimonadaceae bacterium]